MQGKGTKAMKILVTGANGYLGKGVVKKLLEKGCGVIAADCKTDQIDPGATIKSTDLFALEDPFSYFDKPDVLLHMAWKDGFIHNSQSHIRDLPAHYFFIDRMIRGGVRQVAVMGSMHEIGFFEGSISEHTPARPQSFYGISKDALRKAVQLRCRNTDAVFQWLRAFYIVGNTADGSSVFSRIVQAVHRGEKEFPLTSGLNQFDFLDYDTFCSLTADCVMQTEIDGIINVCSGRPEKLSDRVERFIRENDFDIRLNYGAFPDRPYDSKAVWGDDFKIRMLKRDGKKGTHGG